MCLQSVRRGVILSWLSICRLRVTRVTGGSSSTWSTEPATNCPEYESWKRAFLSGGYLPYESSKLILTIVLSSILWLAFIIDVVISTVKDLIPQIWNSYIQKGAFDASPTMDPLTGSPIFCGFIRASSWEAELARTVLLNNVTCFETLIPDDEPECKTE